MLKRIVVDLTNVVGLLLLPYMVLLWSHCQRQHGTVGWHLQWMGCRQVQHFWHETESVQGIHKYLILVPIWWSYWARIVESTVQNVTWTEHCVKGFPWYIFNVNTTEFRLGCATFCVNVKTVHSFCCCFYCKQPEHLIYHSRPHSHVV